MQIFKVIGNTIGSLGKTIENTADLANLIVGDEGLKATTRSSFGIVNTALNESHVMAIAESDYNLAEFKKEHAKKVGRPSKKDKS
tara:strand:- start:493 stop:747 length:255 start_codon:yes stop_codon:yes gene_type:complete